MARVGRQAALEEHVRRQLARALDAVDQGFTLEGGEVRKAALVREAHGPPVRQYGVMHAGTADTRQIQDRVEAVVSCERSNGR